MMPAIGQAVAQAFWQVLVASRRVRFTLPPPDRCAVRVFQDQPSAFGEWRLVPSFEQAALFEFVAGEVFRTRQIDEAAKFARQYARPDAGAGQVGSRPPIREPAAPGTEMEQQLRQKTLRTLLHFLH